MENEGFVKDANAQSMEKSQVKEGEKKPLNGFNSHIYNKEFFSNKKFLYRLAFLKICFSLRSLNK